MKPTHVGGGGGGGDGDGCLRRREKGRARMDGYIVLKTTFIQEKIFIYEVEMKTAGWKKLKKQIALKSFCKISLESCNYVKVNAFKR